MSLHSIIKRAADEEQLKRNPLRAHVAASESENLRLQYALLLSALLNAQPGISEHQSRLLCLLLDSLGLGDIRGSLFEQARELNEEITLQAARLIHEYWLEPFLLVDALVLLRLDVPLDDEVAGLISELASLLNVNEEHLGRCSQVAAVILGLKTAESESAVLNWPRCYMFHYFKTPSDYKDYNSRMGISRKTRDQVRVEQIKRISTDR